jgi:hypothetical protein
VKRVGLAVLAALVAGSVAGVAGALVCCDEENESGPTPTAGQVVFLLVDRVTLAEIEAADTPTLDGLLDGAAVGLVATPVAGVRGGADAYATAGAGAATDVGPTGDLAFVAEEEVAGQPAADLWESFRSREPPERSIVVPYAAYHRRRSEDLRPRAFPGLLGDLLHSAGWTTAVVGNADTPEGPFRPLGLEDPEPPFPPGVRLTSFAHHRAAVLIVSDRAGLADGGDVSARLLDEDPAAPGGTRSDPELLAGATSLAIAAADVVVVDPGDLTRADLAAGDAEDRRLAIEAADSLLARLLAEAGEDTLVLVGGLAPSEVMADDGLLLTPLVVSYPGWFEGGFLTSSTSRIPGLVSSTDIAPTILEALGLHVPRAMRGRAMETVEAGAEDRVARLIEAERESGSVVSSRGAVRLLMLAAGFLAVLAALTAGARIGAAAASAPLWLLLAPGSDLLVIASVTLVLAAAVWWVAGRDVDTTPLVARLAVASALILLVDLAFGGGLQRGSALGPETAAGARFGFLGDPALGVLLAGWLVAAWYLLRWTGWRLLLSVASLALGAFVGVVGHSLSGAVLMAIAGLAVALAPRTGRPVRFGRTLLIGLVAAAVALGVVFLDLVRAAPGPVSGFWRGVQAFGWGEGMGILAHRAVESLVQAVTNPWSLVVAIAAYAVWDGWPFLTQDVRRLTGAAGIAVLAAYLGTDGGPWIAGPVALVVSALVAAALRTGLPAAPAEEPVALSAEDRPSELVGSL